MKRQHFIRTLTGLFFVAIVGFAATGTVQGQFTQNRDTIKIDASGFPAEIKKGYRTFHAKCNQCHGLDTSLKPSLSPTVWTSEVKRMQAMASSQFNDEEAKAILDFLNYDQSHRKAQLKSTAMSPASDSVSSGRQFYIAQSCDTCHSIAGKGGDIGPALNGIGAKMSRAELTQIVKDGKANTTMPALPSGTADQQLNELVDFLASLK